VKYNENEEKPIHPKWMAPRHGLIMDFREAMSLAEYLQLQRFVLASDCLHVVNNLKRRYGLSYSMNND
jgi:hypothetical protein